MSKKFTHLENANDVLAYEAVKAFVREGGAASVELFQRKFKLGYNRACRILEELKAQGLVSALSSVPRLGVPERRFPLVLVVSTNGDRQEVGRDVQIEFVLDKDRAVRVVLEDDVLSLKEVRTGELVLLPRTGKEVVVSSELP